MTATATVQVNGLSFQATATYTMFEPSQDVDATFNFPGIPLSQLSNGDLLTFVFTYLFRLIPSFIEKPGQRRIYLH
jgi:hypothetical protein